jgi:hypothetical protein
MKLLLDVNVPKKKLKSDFPSIKKHLSNDLIAGVIEIKE